MVVEDVCEEGNGSKQDNGPDGSRDADHCRNAGKQPHAPIYGKVA